jgi:endonuclease/exonuclease/phosphatase family metal-dependent hydrolase
LDRMTVLTYNLLSPDHADWPSRRLPIRDELGRLRPDVVALQECVLTPDYDQCADLLGSDYQIVWHSAWSGDGVGAALASRWPVLDDREVDLHVTSRDRPERQAVVTAQAVESEIAGRDRHVVVLGDFDDTPDSASIRYWTGRQSLDGTSVAYRDAWEAVHGGAAGHTFSADNPLTRAGEMALELGRRIDYVLVRCGVHGPSLDIAGCRLVLNSATGGVWPSDHYGVLAALTAPSHPPGAWV